MFNKIYDKLISFIKNNYKFLIVYIIIFIVCVVKLPYVISIPGGAIDVSKRIDTSFSYSEEGSFNMAYVSETKASLPTLLLAAVNKKWDVSKISDSTYLDETYDEMIKRGKIDYQEAIDTASIVALKKAGYEVNNIKKHVYVTYITKEAKTDLKLYDEIINVNGYDIYNINDIKKIINDNNLKEVDVKVIRNGKELTCHANTYVMEKQRFIGITIGTNYDYDSDIKIDFKTKKNESGPSGGLMTTLAIYNKITDKDLSHGKKIIGTGTIDINGNVGEIGGVKYKLLGASREDCDIFLIAKDNYKEALKVKKEYDLDIKIISVETIDDAIRELERLD